MFVHVSTKTLTKVIGPLSPWSVPRTSPHCPYVGGRTAGEWSQRDAKGMSQQFRNFKTHKS